MKQATNKILRRFIRLWISNNQNNLESFAMARVPNIISVRTEDGADAYTHSDYYNNKVKEIVLGDACYEGMWWIKDEFSKQDVLSKQKDIINTYCGLFYHELGHVMYTAIAERTRLLDLISDNNTSNFVAQVTNILEDISIELAMKMKFKAAQVPIELIASLHITADKAKYIGMSISDKPDDVNTFISTLLYFVRLGDMSLLPDYELFNKHEKFIKEGAWLCIDTPSPKLRAQRMVSYGLELAKLFDPEQGDPNMDNVKKPTDPCNGGNGPVVPGNKGQCDSPFENTMHDPCNPSDDNNKQDLPETDETHVAQAPTKEEHEFTDDTFPKELVHMLANNDSDSEYIHTCMSARLCKDTNTSKYKSIYEDLLHNNAKNINQVVNVIRNAKFTNNTSTVRHLSSGKLDVKVAAKSPRSEMKVFKKTYAPKQEADLAVAFMVDMSGSMKGNKAHLAGSALVSISEALHRLQIPFSVYGFSTGYSDWNTAKTIIFKSFDDDYKSVRNTLGLLQTCENVKGLDLWGCNIDEANLQYVVNQLELSKHKDKCLIVLSDGATCGDVDKLRRVAKDAEKYVNLLSIGIYDDNVLDIYSNATVLSNYNDLVELPKFLNKYLVSKVFK